MTRGPWFIVLSLLIAIAITQVSLWMRNIRPSKRISLWEHLIWEMPPKDEQTKAYYSKDEQTKAYYRQRLMTTAIVLPATVLVLYAITEMYRR